MRKSRRSELAEQALAGYPSGPLAPIEATALALERASGASALILVEGVSDQVAVETLALRRGRDLDSEGVVVFPVGGAHGFLPHLLEFGPRGRNLRLAGMYDVGEDSFLRQGLRAAGLGDGDPKESGFHVCVLDLEDELIRAAGIPRAEALLDSQGDLQPFRTLQSQPSWRGRDPAGQLRRFLGSGSRRKLRYAGLLVGVVELDQMPRPLDAVLAAV